jgi:two-component system, sensor histidine kinase YesM
MKSENSMVLSLSRVMHLGVDMFSNIPVSIRTRIVFSFFLIILIMGGVNATVIFSGLQYKYQYDNLLQNITTANSINGYVKPTIDSIMWDIVSGKQNFKEGSQYLVLDDVNLKIKSMMQNTNQEGRIKLDVLLRTLDTLRKKVDLVGEQMLQGDRFDDNMKVLEDIRSITELVNENIQDYVLFEINRTEQNYRETQDNFTRWSVISLVLTLLVILLAMLSAWIISESIYIPIKKFQDVTRTIADKDLEVLMTSENRDEMVQLGLSFNAMVRKIRELLEDKIREQENLKKNELKLLQAQINPHFLYNTLDTIICMAETNKNASVIEIVSALTSFFRVTLSKGKDWIRISEEIEHVRSYLTIQKMRYRDILDFQVDVDEAILGGTILKLTLQPLVENALYHGIKNKRNGGTIWVRGSLKTPDLICLEVEDNGIGFTPSKLLQVQADLSDDSSPVEVSENGFGINNVNKRIKLYYGKQYGLNIESEYLHGTKISLQIPIIRD